MSEKDGQDPNIESNPSDHDIGDPGLMEELAKESEDQAKGKQVPGLPNLRRLAKDESFMKQQMDPEATTPTAEIRQRPSKFHKPQK
jgi:hypothetical protein